jgi:Tfp pilus assembly protein PilX
MHGERSDRGAALIIALMITSLVGALAAALVCVVVTESRVGRNHQSAEAGAYAAAAGLERLIGELRRTPAWAAVPSTSSSAADFNDARSAPTLADGTVLDLARLTTDRQAASNAFYPSGPDQPVWTLYAHASLARITSGDPRMANPYIVVWVADDPDDTDGDPSRDSNGAILVRAEAFGVRGGRRAVEATLAASPVRDDAGVTVMSTVTVVAWREAR